MNKEWICTYYREKNANLRFAIIADLHEHEYDYIIETLKNIKPDYILCPGDTLERCHEQYALVSEKQRDAYTKRSAFNKLIHFVLKTTHLNYKNDIYLKLGYGLEFIKQASSIAPVILSVGNHEWYFSNEDREVFEQYHVTVLDNQDTEIENIRIGGFSSCYDLEWLKEFSKKDKRKLLLCHHPEQYIRLIKNQSFDTFSYVISGHAHGGQFQLFSHGFYSPSQGFFPSYIHGRYGKMIVSAGVSNTLFIPRWNNPKEIVVLELCTKGGKR